MTKSCNGVLKNRFKTPINKSNVVRKRPPRFKGEFTNFSGTSFLRDLEMQLNVYAGDAAGLTPHTVVKRRCLRF